MSMMQFLKNLGSTLSLGTSFFKAILQMMYGAWKISYLPQPIISIFGGSRLKPESPYVEQAYQLASMLTDQNISIITGGGPGIMEAASRGAARAKPGKVRSMGIGVVGLKGEKSFNQYVKHSLRLDYFFARKYLLINFSVGFVVFPGGVGTVDEFAELLTHIQTGKLKPAPIILIGTNYWKDFFAWVKVAQDHALLSPEEIELITLTDDLALTTQILKEHCENCMQRQRHL